MPQKPYRETDANAPRAKRRSGIELPYLFMCLPIAAAYLLTAYPTPRISVAHPIAIPATFLILALVTCAVTLMVEAVRTRQKTQVRPPIVMCSVLLLLGTVLYMVGTVLSGPTGTPVSPLTIVSALLIGCGGALLLLLWTCAYVQLPVWRILPNLAASIVLGGAFVFISMSIAPLLDTTTKALMLLVISSTPLSAIVETTSSGHLVVLEKITPPKSIIPAGITKMEDWQRAEFALGVLVLYWAVCACSWGDIAAQGPFMGSARNEVAIAIGIVISGIGVLIACHNRTGKENAELEKQIEFTASITAAFFLMISWGLTQLFPTQEFIVGIILGVGQGLALCTATSAVARIAYWVGPVRAISVSGALMCVFLLVLASVAFFHPSAGMGIAVILNAIYIVIAIAWRLSLHFRHSKIQRTYDQGQQAKQ